MCHRGMKIKRVRALLLRVAIVTFLWSAVRLVFPGFSLLRGHLFRAESTEVFMPRHTGLFVIKQMEGDRGTEGDLYSAFVIRGLSLCDTIVPPSVVETSNEIKKKEQKGTKQKTEYRYLLDIMNTSECLFERTIIMNILCY